MRHFQVGLYDPLDYDVPVIWIDRPRPETELATLRLAIAMYNEEIEVDPDPCLIAAIFIVQPEHTADDTSPREIQT